MNGLGQRSLAGHGFSSESMPETASPMTLQCQTASEKRGLTQDETRLLQQAIALLMSVAKLVDELAALGRDSEVIRDASLQTLEFVEGSIKPIRKKSRGETESGSQSGLF